MTGQPTPAIFNNAAQIWNHTFYWHSLCAPIAGATDNKPLPTSKIFQAIETSFKEKGGYEGFKKQFTDTAAGHFGSGWAWLVLNEQRQLEVIGTHDAGNPLTQGKIPILTCDVWEHAYYIDYRNNRANYIESWWKLVNWQFAEKQLLIAIDRLDKQSK